MRIPVEELDPDADAVEFGITHIDPLVILGDQTLTSDDTPWASDSRVRLVCVRRRPGHEQNAHDQG